MYKNKKRISRKIEIVAILFFFLLPLQTIFPSQQDLPQNLGRPQDYISKRVSSFDRTGGNNDRISIPPGETAVLAEIQRPATAASGFMRLENRITPSERGIVYGLVYVHSPDERETLMLVGSDDGVAAGGITWALWTLRARSAGTPRADDTPEIPVSG